MQCLIFMIKFQLTQLSIHCRIWNYVRLSLFFKVVVEVNLNWYIAIELAQVTSSIMMFAEVSSSLIISVHLSNQASNDVDVGNVTDSI